MNTKTRRKPQIVMTRSQHQQLSALAAGISQRRPEESDELFAELDRARIVDDGRIADDVVRMGSRVTFQPIDGEARTVTLVYPGEADISLGKISVLTPIGTALLGLSPGQSIGWAARDGRQHELKVIDVTAEEASAPDDHEHQPKRSVAGL
jgi:regulator of nucleoside diphosphate kinase